MLLVPLHGKDSSAENLVRLRPTTCHDDGSEQSLSVTADLSRLHLFSLLVLPRGIFGAVHNQVASTAAEHVSRSVSKQKSFCRSLPTHSYVSGYVDATTRPNYSLAWRAFCHCRILLMISEYTLAGLACAMACQRQHRRRLTLFRRA